MQELLLHYGTRALELIVAFAGVLIFLKIFGVNYQLKQMTSFDLIINFILAAILGGFIMNNSITTPKFIVIMSMYIAMVYAVNLLARKTDWGRRLMIGAPKAIIQDGRLDERMLDRLNLSVHDIASALRQQKVHSLTDVKMAQIEPGGDLTIVKKGAGNYSLILIDNGIVDESALQEINKNEAWLRRQLAARKIKSAGDVFVAQWYRGRLHVVRKA